MVGAVGGGLVMGVRGGVENEVIGGGDAGAGRSTEMESEGGGGNCVVEEAGCSRLAKTRASPRTRDALKAGAGPPQGAAMGGKLRLVK
jgi:hypothetical protein